MFPIPRRRLILIFILDFLLIIKGGGLFCLVSNLALETVEAATAPSPAISGRGWSNRYLQFPFYCLFIEFVCLFVLWTRRVRAGGWGRGREHLYWVCSRYGCGCSEEIIISKSVFVQENRVLVSLAQCSSHTFLSPNQSCHKMNCKCHFVFIFNKRGNWRWLINA